MNPFVEHLYIFLMFIPILSVHEAAHAWAAHLLGDDTARDEGRLTLNPISHIDLWGSLLLPAMSVFFSPGSQLIGWGRPVPVNPGNLAHWRRDEVLIALAGPLANFLTALLSIAVLVFAVPHDSPWVDFFSTFAYVAAYLGFLNFIPIPPLDGWRTLCAVSRLPVDFFERGQFWYAIVFVLFFSFTPVGTVLDVLTHGTLLEMRSLLSGGRFL